MSDSTRSDRGATRGKRSHRAGQRLGTPKPEWGDNVIEADFGARARRIPAQPQTSEVASRSSSVRSRPGVESEAQRTAPASVGWSALQILEEIQRRADTARQSRGRTYFRSGHVHSLDFDLGTVSSLVTGSQLEPFEVSLRWRPLSANQMSYVAAECLEHPDNLTGLLAGRAPRRDVAAVLLSPDQFIDSWCTCPDRSGMCKHRIAVAHAVAEKFTNDPIAFLDWRGIDARNLLDTIKTRGGSADNDSSGTSSADGTSESVTDLGGSSGDREETYDPAAFWGNPTELPSWIPLDVEQGLSLGDLNTRNAVIRRLSWNAVDQLHVLDELQTCYDLLTQNEHEERTDPKAREPWLISDQGEGSEE